MIKIHNNQIKVCVKDQNSHARCVLFMCINVHGYTFFAKNELYAGKSEKSRFILPSVLRHSKTI